MARIAKQLQANPAAPGDQFHYNQVRDTAAVHIPDVIEAWVPPSAPPSTVNLPAKVVAGSVVG